MMRIQSLYSLRIEWEFIVFCADVVKLSCSTSNNVEKPQIIHDFRMEMIAIKTWNMKNENVIFCMAWNHWNSMNIKYACYVQENYEFFNIHCVFFCALTFLSYVFSTFTPFTIIIENIFSSAIFLFLFPFSFFVLHAAYATMSIRSGMIQKWNKKHTKKSCWIAARKWKERGFYFSVIFFFESHLEIWQDVQQNGTRPPISYSLKTSKLPLI